MILPALWRQLYLKDIPDIVRVADIAVFMPLPPNLAQMLMLADPADDPALIYPCKATTPQLWAISSTGLN
jgi:hypothetical protein